MPLPTEKYIACKPIFWMHVDEKVKSSTIIPACGAAHIRKPAPAQMICWNLSAWDHEHPHCRYGCLP